MYAANKDSPTARDCAALLIETLPMSMRILSGLMRHRRAGDEEQLSIGQLRMLAMLRERPWSLGDLAQRHHVAPSTMSRTIDALVKRALVARETDPEDRRLVIVKLTGEGHSAH